MDSPITFKENDNMKKIMTLTGIVAIALVFVMAGTAAAQKIGFINMRAIMSQSDAGKKAEVELKKVMEKKKVDIAKKEDELKKMKDEIEKQKSVLSAEAYREKESNYQVKFRDYQRQVQDANEELAKKEQALTGVMIPEILKVVEQVGKQGKYDAILDLNNPVVVYHDKEDNLTKKIIEEYNKGAGKSAPAPAKGKK
jgi:outer membrane protein